MLFYRLLTDLTAPLIALYLRRRKAKGREDSVRFAERLGHASAHRPQGKLAWCHAASVGEAMSVLALLKALRRAHPAWHFLLTTGTVTSATLVKDRLPEGVTHQYVPVDRWPYVTRFLDHWRPDAALWVESELWPNMLAAIKERHIPAALINGRMSEKTYRRWRMIPAGARRLLSAFTMGFAQTGVEANRFASLGLENIRAIGNLKYAAEPLPCDKNQLSELLKQIEARPVWMMASTHPGEEEIALRVHQALAPKHPGLLTLIVPRHPGRGRDIADLFSRQKFSFVRRSTGAPLLPSTEIYLADTLGEMGLFYRLCPLVCLAGSFTWGGHNPIEPAQLGCAVLFGPKMDNFLIMADDMLGSRAARQVMDENELVENIDRWLSHPDEAKQIAAKARVWAEEKHHVLDETIRLISPLFSPSLIKANP